jgi:NADH dehydrogenase
MPVVVTGASGLVGRHAVKAFLTVSPQVRAYVRRPEAAEELRKLGAKVAVGDITDVDQLSTVMSGAHTVCHLVGGLEQKDVEAYLQSNLGSANAVVEAARGAGIARILFLSYPGASPEASNAYLRAKGLAEDSVRASGLQHVIIRCTHVYGRGGRWLTANLEAARGPIVAVVGSGRQVVAPVFVEDVAAVLAAADDRASESSGTWGLEGLDRLTVDELTDMLAGRPRRKLHLWPRGRPWRFAPALAARFSPTLLEILAADSVADAPDAAAEFGVTLTPLAEGLPRSLPA